MNPFCMFYNDRECNGNVKSLTVNTVTETLDFRQKYSLPQKKVSTFVQPSTQNSGGIINYP